MDGARRKTSEPEIIWCRKCGKLHGIRDYPVDANGNRPPQFLFTCLQCGKTEIRDKEEIVRPANYRHD